MTTESELIQARDDAQKALDAFRAKPKIKVYKNMPVFVNGKPRYASHLDSRDWLIYFKNGATSYTNGDRELAIVAYWQPDYDRPSLLSWRPVDDSIPEHKLWLLKLSGGFIRENHQNKRDTIEDYPECECLPLYEDK